MTEQEQNQPSLTIDMVKQYGEAMWQACAKWKDAEVKRDYERWKEEREELIQRCERLNAEIEQHKKVISSQDGVIGDLTAEIDKLNAELQSANAWMRGTESERNQRLHEEIEDLREHLAAVSKK